MDRLGSCWLQIVAQISSRSHRLISVTSARIVTHCHRPRLTSRQSLLSMFAWGFFFDLVNKYDQIWRSVNICSRPSGESCNNTWGWRKLHWHMPPAPVCSWTKSSSPSQSKKRYHDHLISGFSQEWRNYLFGNLGKSLLSGLADSKDGETRNSAPVWKIFTWWPWDSFAWKGGSSGVLIWNHVILLCCSFVNSFPLFSVQ